LSFFSIWSVILALGCHPASSPPPSGLFVVEVPSQKSRLGFRRFFFQESIPSFFVEFQRVHFFALNFCLEGPNPAESDKPLLPKVDEP